MPLCAVSGWRDLNRAMKSSAVPKNIALGGVLNAEANAAWGKTFDDVVAHADATMHASVSEDSCPGYSRGERDSWHLYRRQSGTRPEAELSANAAKHINHEWRGKPAVEPGCEISVQQSERARDHCGSLPHTSTQPLGLAGTASFQGTVRGSTSAPHLTGQLTASQFRVNGTEWRVLRTNVDVSPSLASLQHADLEPASHGKITFNASAGLRKWAFTETSPLQVDLNAAQLDVQDLVKLSGQQVPVTGTLAANVQVHGTELSPIGQGNLSLTHITAYDQPITLCDVDLRRHGR